MTHKLRLTRIGDLAMTTRVGDGRALARAIQDAYGWAIVRAGARGSCSAVRAGSRRDAQGALLMLGRTVLRERLDAAQKAA